jgi:hypothetical protein
MANRYTTQFINNLQKGVNKINATVSFGAAGAPTIVRGANFNSQGLVSVTRNSQGVFTFVFGTQAGMLDVYNSLLSVSVVFNTVATAAVPAAPIYYVSGLAVATPASCSLQLTFLDADTPAVTDPASGEIGYFEFTLKNSTAP